jgi:hypothetical protein
MEVLKMNRIDASDYTAAGGTILPRMSVISVDLGDEDVNHNRNTATGGRSMAATASAVADAGAGTTDDIDVELARLNAGVSLEQRIAKLQKKQTIEEAKEKQQADKVAADQDDEAWLDKMTGLAERKKPAEEPLSDSDEAWVSKMIGFSGQAKK